MPTATAKRPKFTPETARTFERYSVANAAQAMRSLQEAGCCKGTCEPYQDIFTYNRWAAQGYFVRKGQHGAKLPVIVASETEGEEGEKITQTRPWVTTVFCRCQVAVKESGANVLQHASAH